MRNHPNAIVFTLGLAVLCASVAAWSVVAAGMVLGGVLMTVAAWPFLRQKGSD